MSSPASASLFPFERTRRPLLEKPPGQVLAQRRAREGGQLRSLRRSRAGRSAGLGFALSRAHASNKKRQKWQKKGENSDKAGKLNVAADRTGPFGHCCYTVYVAFSDPAQNAEVLVLGKENHSVQRSRSLDAKPTDPKC